MTQSRPEKFRKTSLDPARVWVWLLGFVEALLLARFVARVLAARPENPAFELLYTLTDPLVAPFAALDYDQPPFGAAVEFSALTLAILVPALGYLVWIVLRRAATRGDSAAS
jgi:uncharacterized protein YggT (Ycf19 family)